ncbi:MAG: kelch repeat-containing protein, partial [Bacteroidota bacterium]
MVRKAWFRTLLSVLVVLITGSCLTAQIGINADNVAPDSSAILDLKSSRQGFLYPRMTTTERDAILSPATGLTIFNLDDQCTDIYDGTTWMKDCPLRASTDTLVLNNWAQKVNAPIRRTGAAAFTINGKIYLGTGFDGDSLRTDFWEYDLLQDTWSQKANFPGQPRGGALAFSLNGMGFMGTGNTNGIGSSDLYKYDPTTDTWSPVAPVPGSARFEAFSFTLNNRAYVGGGQGNTGLISDFHEYDPINNSWTVKASFPGGGRQAPISFAINGKGYIGAGAVSGANPKGFLEYDPSQNTWSAKADFPGENISRPGSFAVAGKGYVATG